MLRDPGLKPTEVRLSEGAVVFVADLHLSDGDPACRDRFRAFLAELGEGALFLLGDTFHIYWGPELLKEPFWTPLLASLRDFSRRGTVFFLPGNRDYGVGPEFARESGARLAGESVEVRLGRRRVFACHGDQLCRDDVKYQRMKRVIRDRSVIKFWLALPVSLRKRLAAGLRTVALRSLAAKDEPQLRPTERTLRMLFSRGADVVVSGHRHLLGTRRYRVGKRSCLHLELPPWCEDGIFLMARKDFLSLEKFEPGEGIVPLPEKIE